MNIQFYQQFFPGPHAPGTLQTRKLVQLLASRGHVIDVIACDFNASNEQTEPEETIEMPGGGRAQVHRLPAARGMRKSLRARLQTYTAFAWKAYGFGRALPRPDVVIGTIQPLFSGYAGLQTARRHGVPFILEVRDLWPDALEAKGAIKSWQAQILHRLANHLYARADRIVSLTPGIKIELLKKGISRARLDVFTNGFDPEIYELPAGAREQVRAELGWDGQFVALYVGTHVEVTAVEVIVKAAAELRDRTDIRFDLFGQGQRKPAAMRLAEELQLTNLHFHDPVPKRRVPHLLAGADAALMTLFRSPLIHIYFENKFLDYMGAGKPILAAMEGQQAEIIARHDTGQVVPAFDHAGLARLVADAADHREKYRSMGTNGRRLVEEHFLLPRILERYAAMIEAVAAGGAVELAPWEPLP